MTILRGYQSESDLEFLIWRFDVDDINYAEDHLASAIGGTDVKMMGGAGNA